MHGFEELLKLSFTNSSLFTLKHSIKYLALKAIVRSLPLKTILTFSLMFPISEFEVNDKFFSLISNLTRLFWPILESREALSRAFKLSFVNCYISFVIVGYNLFVI